MPRKASSKKKKKKVVKTPMGRPRAVTFDGRLLSCINELAAAGKNDVQIADILGINVRTLYRYKVQNGDLCHAIKAGKEIIDDLVEQSLLSRALGHTTTETKVFLDKTGQIISEEFRKHYPPDPASMIFFLKNRRPEKWRDKIEQEVTMNNIEPVVIETDTKTIEMTMEDKGSIEDDQE